MLVARFLFIASSQVSLNWTLKVLFIMWPLLPINFSYGQNQPRRMISLSIDNDFFACQGADGAYTSGIEFEYLYQPNPRQRNIFGPHFLAAGKRSVNTYGFGIAQFMYTPNNIGVATPEPGDYPYSGSLFISHTINSLDDAKGLSLETSYLFGVMGRYSFAAQTQEEFHRLVASKDPAGWDNQFSNTVMFNIRSSGEKLLKRFENFAAVILRGDIDVGSVTNAISLGLNIRVGDGGSYFKNKIGRAVALDHKRFIWNLFFKAKFQYVATNTLLSGKLMNTAALPDEVAPDFRIRNLLFHNELGISFAYRCIGLSCAYKTHSGLIINQPTKSYGNISLSVAL